jgi:hypothetical protein
LRTFNLVQALFCKNKKMKRKKENNKTTKQQNNKTTKQQLIRTP